MTTAELRALLDNLRQVVKEGGEYSTGVAHHAAWCGRITFLADKACTELATQAAQIAAKDKTIAVLRRDIADPSGDIQEAVIRKLDLVPRERAERAEAENAKLRAVVNGAEFRLGCASLGKPNFYVIPQHLINAARAAQEKP